MAVHATGDKGFVLVIIPQSLPQMICFPNKVEAITLRHNFVSLQTGLRWNTQTLDESFRPLHCGRLALPSHPNDGGLAKENHVSWLIVDNQYLKKEVSAIDGPNTLPRLQVNKVDVAHLISLDPFVPTEIRTLGEWTCHCQVAFLVELVEPHVRCCFKSLF